jgi:hypothetical protein
MYFLKQAKKDWREKKESCFYSCKKAWQSLKIEMIKHILNSFLSVIFKIHEASNLNQD